MARLILLILFAYSCASSEKSSDTIMTVDMRNNVFAYQNYVLKLIETNDPLYAGLKNLTCKDNWLDTVTGLNKKLKTLKNDNQRSPVWQELATCYYFAKKPKYSLYYYDLALTKEKNSKRKSLIHSNIGQMYLDRGSVSFANSSFYTALKLNRSNISANYHLAIYNLNLGNYAESLSHLGLVEKIISKSKMVKFLKGVNYFLMNSKSSLNNKVLKYLDDQSIEKGLLRIAVGLRNNDKSALEELEALELKLKVHENFRTYLIRSYGK